MKILIIGSYGFLGTNLLNKLGSNVNYEIYVLIKKTSKSRQKNLNHHRVFYYEDLEGDKSLFNNKFDAIIDCSVCYGRKEKSSEVYITNFINPLKIIEYSINNTGLYIGFDSYYSKKEFQNMEYLNHYTKSKSFFINSIKNLKNIKYINLQLEHLYGPFDSESKFIPSIINKIKSNQKTIDLTSGKQKRDFVYVEDVLTLIEKILMNQSKVNFGVSSYNVGTGKTISIEEFLKKIKKTLKSSSQLKFGKLENLKGDFHTSKANISKLQEDFNWTPKFTFEQGINEILKKIK